MSISTFIVMCSLYPQLLLIWAFGSSLSGRGAKSFFQSCIVRELSSFDPGLILNVPSWYDYVWLPPMIFSDDLSVISWFLAINSLLLTFSQPAGALLTVSARSIHVGTQMHHTRCGLMAGKDRLPARTTRKHKLYCGIYWSIYCRVSSCLAFHSFTYLFIQSFV